MPRKGGIPENLKPFQKGPDPRRNTKGRPKALPDINEILAEILGEEEDGVLALKKVCKALLVQAKKGNVRATESLLDRAYGKPKQAIDLTTNGESIHTTVIIKDPRSGGPANEPTV